MMYILATHAEPHSVYPLLWKPQGDDTHRNHSMGSPTISWALRVCNDRWRATY